MSIDESVNVAAISTELQSLQKQRAWYMKSRNMIANRLQATVAGTIGYHTNMDPVKRKGVFAEATKLIRQTVDGDAEPECKSLILTTMIAVDAYNHAKTAIEKEMTKAVKSLPIAEWVAQPDQRGFGILFTGIIIGETGDLCNYANPGKVWRRLGCAPWTKDGETLMGATWKGRSKSKGNKLHAADWEEFGYSPRRRSIAYLIGDGLIKQNGDGPYRARWLEAKVRALETHPEWEWKPCEKCKTAEGTCKTCGGTGQKCGRAHSHGMLLASKLLLKNLWIEWTLNT